MKNLITNEDLLLFIENYKKSPSDCELQFYFKKIKKYFGLKNFHDKHGVFEESDIEIIAFESFWKAILKFDQNRWDNALGWVYHIVKQGVIREINKTDKEGKNTCNSRMDPNLEIENLEEYVFDSGEIKIDERFIEDIHRLHDIIFSVSKRAGKTFQLRLAFPDASRTTIAKILGAKRRNGIAKLVKIIKTVSNNKLDKEILDALFKD
jgi:hypothetical protein